MMKRLLGDTGRLVRLASAGCGVGWVAGHTPPSAHAAACPRQRVPEQLGPGGGDHGDGYFD